uniref:Uncharacterized protein n=1 Tax=Polytomella parva TaxID=51329 RepID=A0A7S0V870_9CHLO|mmetsp:Transcript_30135/g.55074  ORF Transcript_30135/g.55074 Transcript_30135/m.55074 type:complete len:475 (+) Transcript_30135:248-1672(+)
MMMPTHKDVIHHNTSTIKRRLLQLLRFFYTYRTTFFAYSVFFVALLHYTKVHYPIHFPRTGQDSSTQTCTDKFQSVGLDFGEGDSLRVSVSQHALARRKLYESMAVAASRDGITLGGVVTQGLSQQDLFQFTPLLPSENGSDHNDQLKHILEDKIDSNYLSLIADSSQSLSNSPNIRGKLSILYKKNSNHSVFPVKKKYVLFQDSKTHDDFVISPLLHALKVPVRAIILPLRNPSTSARMRDAISRWLMPKMDSNSSSVPKADLHGIATWPQDWQMLHATLFHASSHSDPKPASAAEVAVELESIRRTTQATCPIKAILERVVLTPLGVVVGCWQVLHSGGEPAEIRRALTAALPAAPPPEQQMIRNPVILHTTLARFLLPRSGIRNTSVPFSHSLATPAHPYLSPGVVGTKIPEATAAAMREMVRKLSDELCGLETEFNEAWFVEEHDLLALALYGSVKHHMAQFQCPKRLMF